MLSLAWAACFQFATEVADPRFDNLVSHVVLPQLAGACYMIIVGACLSTLDCSRSGSSWVLDGSTTRCWDLGC